MVLVDVAFKTSLTPYWKSKSLGYEGSMVTKMKLKGINIRIKPRVKLAT